MRRKRGDFICGRTDQKNALNVMHKALSRSIESFLLLLWDGVELDSTFPHLQSY